MPWVLKRYYSSAPPMKASRSMSGIFRSSSVIRPIWRELKQMSGALLSRSDRSDPNMATWPVYSAFTHRRTDYVKGAVYLILDCAPPICGLLVRPIQSRTHTNRNCSVLALLEHLLRGEPVDGRSRDLNHRQIGIYLGTMMYLVLDKGPQPLPNCDRSPSWSHTLPL